MRVVILLFLAIFVSGCGGPVDPVTSLRMRAERNDAVAQLQLGMRFQMGDGVEKDDARAVQWFRRAAEQGNAEAQHKLAECYGRGWGVRLDFAEMHKWDFRAAKQGDTDAQFCTGLWLITGMGVKKDPVEGVKWVRMAADKGHQMASWRLGYSYLIGQGVEPDFDAAVKWFLAAGEKCPSRDQYTVAQDYDHGRSTKQNSIKAVHWYRMAAEKGHEGAQFSLGMKYAYGIRGSRQDRAEAAKWFRMAAEQGNAASQYEMGLLYAKGEGVIQDDVEACRYFLLASAGGDDDAVAALQKQRAQMAPADYAEAQRRAKSWQEAHDSEKKPGGMNTEAPGKPDSAHRELGSCSGFIVSEDGYFLTCAHALRGAKHVEVFVKKDKHAASIIAVDDVNDIALLRLTGKRFTPMPLRLAQAETGERVFTTGFPNPRIQGTTPKLTEGVISAGTGMLDDIRIYQIAVPVQTGNSGGFLSDTAGNAIGIVIAKLNAAAVFAYTGDIPQNVNFAVKASYAMPLLRSVPGLVSRLPKPDAGLQGTVDTAVAAVAEQSAGLVVVSE